jgi:putative tryptophan/tyrosine transport system substrate-binding protein
VLELDSPEHRRADSAAYGCIDALVNSNQMKINQQALSARLPTMYSEKEFVVTGGLISYGANILALFGRAAEMVDKILKGAKPADIPVERPTKFELIINLKTAKAPGLDVPPSLLALVGEVMSRRV